MSAWWLAAALPLFSASGCCKVYCPEMLTVVFLDRAGAPLTPESVTIVEEELPAAPEFNDPRVCGSAEAQCSDNRLTFDLSRRTKIRARATTGEIFEGEVSPAWAQSPKPEGVCECSGTIATVELTLTPP
jgi:hypothetical protein